jgi:hypothetical protein
MALFADLAKSKKECCKSEHQTLPRVRNVQPLHLASYGGCTCPGAARAGTFLCFAARLALPLFTPAKVVGCLRNLR